METTTPIQTPLCVPYVIHYSSFHFVSIIVYSRYLGCRAKCSGLGLDRTCRFMVQANVESGV